jgi:hypothetical protein
VRLVIGDKSDFLLSDMSTTQRDQTPAALLTPAIVGLDVQNDGLAHLADVPQLTLHVHRVQREPDAAGGNARSTV